MHSVPIALTLFMVAHGWGGGHQVIRERAVASLPAWQHELLGESASALCNDYLSLQDQHAGGQRPELDAYCLPEGPGVSLHDINDVSRTTIAMRWFLQRIRDCVQAGEIDEAARYLGVLCHWFEDVGSPTMHATEGFINEPFLRELLPPSGDQQRRHYLYGAYGIADTGHYDLPPEEDYAPVLLGRTIPEAALHMQRRQKLQARGGRQAIVPLVMAMQHGYTEEAARIRGRLLAEQAETSADVVFTALSLATDRIEGDTSHLDTVPLTDFVSDYRGGRTSRPWLWVPFLIDACFDTHRDIVELQVLSDDGVTSFDRGVGMGTPFALRWTFGPAGVYSRFSVTVGLHPESATEAATVFRLLANGEEIPHTEPITAGEPGRALEVILPAGGDAIELTLQTQLPEDVSGEGCLAVWGAPRLLK